MSNNFELRRIRDAKDPEVLSLVARSDEYLSSLYPDESNHAEPLEALITESSVFFGGYIDDRLVACGAVKFVAEDVRYGEIKRVFVAEDQRGKALASMIMQQLELFTAQSGVSVVRLEAGPLQPEALRFYCKIGYVERGPFGPYTSDPLSVFMEKLLNV